MIIQKCAILRSDWTLTYPHAIVLLHHRYPYHAYKGLGMLGQLALEQLPEVVQLWRVEVADDDLGTFEHRVGHVVDEVLVVVVLYHHVRVLRLEVGRGLKRQSKWLKAQQSIL